MSVSTRDRRRRSTPTERGSDSEPVRAAFVPPWLVPVALALLCLAAYSNAFDAGFALDNRQLILQDPRVHAVTPENLRLIVHHTYWWPYGESGLYRPLATLSYLFNFAVMGNADRPAGYHWFNLLFHVANVLLLWRIVGRLTGCAWTSGAAAAIWAVVPLSTEAVTNIVGRADLMAATGALMALWLYLRAREAPHLSRAAAWAGVALAVTAGALAKESAVAIIGVLVVVEWLWWTPGASGRRLALLAAFCAVPLGVWAWQRAEVLGASRLAEFPFTDNPIVGATFWQGRLTAVHVMWRYLALLIWPAHLSNDYSYAQVPLAGGSFVDWAAALLLTGGAVAGVWQLRANRAAVCFAAASFITFLPASNLLFATGTIMGERLVYLPSAGLAVLVAMALRAWATSAVRLRVATALAALAVLAFAARTYARNPDWKNDVTLWRAGVAAAPASAKAHRALAEALYDTDPTHANIDVVIAEADRAVALLDTLPDERNTFQAFRQAGAYYLDKAGSLSGDSGSATAPDVKRLYSRGLNLLDRAVMIARAGAARIEGASLEPEADAQRLRAAAILGLDNPPLALTAARRSRELSPMHPLAYHLSAAALLDMNRGEEAAMTLLTGGIVSGDPSLGREAMDLYASGLDPDGCAVTGAGSAAALNPRCAIVTRHSCIASAAAYQILKKAGQGERAEQTKAAALSGLGCPADLMDRANSLVP